MSYTNCPICGKLFEQQGFYEVCSDCFIQNQNDFAKVREYLYANPNKNMLEVSDATGVSLSKIRDFLRNGRLTSST